MVSIRNWESNWERTFRELDDIFFSPSIANMATYLIENIDYVLDNKKWRLGREPSRILSLLIQKSSSSEIETRILFLAVPSAIKFLRSIVNPNPDLKTLRRHLIKIVQTYDSNSFLSAARRILLHILNDKNMPDYQLSLVIPFILRSLMKRYSHEYVKGIPKKVFARCFADIYKARIADDLRSSQQVSAEVEPSFRELLASASNKLNTLEDEQIGEFCEALYRDRQRWRIEPYFLFRKYRATILKNETTITKFLDDARTGSADISSLLEEPMRDVARQCIRVVVLNIILKCLLDTYPITQGILALSKKPYPVAVSDTIKKAIHGNGQSYARYFYLAADSEIWAFARSMSNELAKNIPISILSQVAEKLKELSTHFIAREHAQYNSKSISFKIGLVDKATLRFDCFHAVKKYLKDLMPVLVVHTRSELSGLSTKKLIRTRKEFFTEHIRLIINRLSKQGIDNYPDPVSAKDAKRLFDNLFSRFHPQKERRWRVFFELGGIDCKGRIFRIGKVTFYDARDWYFGETESFDAHSNPVASVGMDLKSLYRSYEIIKYDNGEEELKRNSARAFVNLKAIDGYTAAHKAELLVNDSLDDLVFASSSRNEDRGFKPQLPLAFHVTDASTGSGFTQFSSVKRSEMLEVDEKYDKIIEYYDKLAKFRNMKYRDSLRRAFSLFRRGFWDESVSSQFRNYWIALEQLIENVPRTARSRKSSLIDLVPKLTVTWQDTPVAYNVGGLMRNVMTEIRTNQQLAAKVSRHPKLKHWEKYPVLILENIPYLLKNVTNNIIKGNLTELHEIFEGRGKPILRSTILTLRQAEELRVGILKATRNSLTHQGLTYFEADKIITHSLQRLLVEVLGVLLSNIDSKNIEETIRHQNRPMTIRLRNR